MSEVQIVRNSGFYGVRELTGLDKAEFDLALTKLVKAGLVRQVGGSYIGYAGDAYRITHTFRKIWIWLKIQNTPSEIIVNHC
jgi:acyl CoA:acetate/3-ketoacid CoA transferase alpha subunit